MPNDNPILSGLYQYDNLRIPRNVRLLGTNSSTLTISWNAPENASGVQSYNIYNLTPNIAGSQQVLIASTSGTMAILSGLNTNQTYYFAISTLVNNAAVAEIEYRPLSPTTKIINSSTIRLSWSIPSGTPTSISGYRVWRSNNFYETLESIGSTLETFYIDSGLSNLKAYYYRVTSLY